MDKMVEGVWAGDDEDRVMCFSQQQGRGEPICTQSHWAPVAYDQTSEFPERPGFS